MSTRKRDSDTAILNHNEYVADVETLLKNRAEKKALDAKSRVYDTAIKTLRAKLFLALGGREKGICGAYSITLKPERHTEGMLTLKDGRKIPLSDITDIVFNGGNDVVTPDQVDKWYGGATTGADLDITLTGV